MRHQLKQILPPWWIISLFVVTYALMDLLACPVDPRFATEVRDVTGPRLGLVAIASALYGAYRVLALHPLCRRDYSQWLETTPWMIGKPLPLGPIHLVWGDALVLGVLGFAAIRVDGTIWALPLAMFLAGYLAALTITLLLTGGARFAYAILFAGGWAILTGSWAWATTVGVVAYGVGYVGLRRSLERFPWPARWTKAQVDMNLVPTDPEVMKSRLGWPFSRLQPFENKACISNETAMAVSLVAAWHLYVAQATGGRSGFEWAGSMYGLSLVGVPLVRSAIYLGGIRPPISLLGRLATGRLVIRGFDRVFVAPLAAVISGGLIPIALNAAGVGLGLALPVAAGAVLWVGMSWGPTLAEWRLTGEHQLSPGFGPGTLYVRL